MSQESRRTFLGGAGLAGLAGAAAATGFVGLPDVADLSNTAQAHDDHGHDHGQAKTEKQLEKVDPSKIWSTPVNGIRARLVATQDSFSPNHPTSLIMLFQNISDKAVEIPGGVRVMPMLTPKNDHPFGEKHHYNAAIWMTQPNTEVHILWGLRAVMQEARELMAIKPGDIHMTIVNITPRKQAERLQRIREANDVHRATARLALSSPGNYILEAIWDPDGLAKEQGQKLKLDKKWQGKKIIFPPIKVRIEKEGQDEGEEELKQVKEK